MPRPVPFPRSTANIAGHPLHVMLVPIPIVCFVGTLVSDLIYWKTANMIWADMSAWAVSVGALFGGLAAILGLIDFLSEPRIRALRAAWVHFLCNVLVLLIAIVNAFVHSRDAWTSVVPTGLILSALTVAILIVSGWNGWAMIYRHGVAVRPGEIP